MTTKDVPIEIDDKLVNETVSIAIALRHHEEEQYRSLDAAMREAARRVAANHATMPGPILAACHREGLAWHGDSFVISTVDQIYGLLDRLSLDESGD